MVLKHQYAALAIISLFVLIACRKETKSHYTLEPKEAALFEANGLNSFAIKALSGIWHQGLYGKGHHAHFSWGESFVPNDSIVIDLNAKKPFFILNQQTYFIDTINIVDEYSFTLTTKPNQQGIATFNKKQPLFINLISSNKFYTSAVESSRRNPYYKIGGFELADQGLKPIDQSRLKQEFTKKEQEIEHLKRY